MSSKTKILVLHMKELIYTGIFILLGIILLLLLFSMFKPDSSKNTPKQVTKQEAQFFAPPVLSFRIQILQHRMVEVDIQKSKAVRHIHSSLLYKQFLCFLQCLFRRTFHRGC